MDEYPGDAAQKENVKINRVSVPGLVQTERKGKMIQFYGTLAAMMAAVAMTVTTLVANSTCIYLTYQEELPESAKSLRKF